MYLSPWLDCSPSGAGTLQQSISYVLFKVQFVLINNGTDTDQNRGFLFVGWLVDSLRQGFSVALEPVLELALEDQVGLELTEICLSLPPECWD